MYRNYKPMQFFSILAAVLAIIAIIFFIPIMAEFMATGLVPKIPTLIVVCFVMLAAVLCFFTGLVLSTLVQQDRQGFEFKLNLVEKDLREER